MKIKGAIFDCDGTLVDSLGFWKIFYEMLGEKYFGDKTFWPKTEDDHAMRTQNVAFLGQLLHEKYGVGKDGEEIRDYFYERFTWYYDEVVPLKPGVAEFLASLKRHGVKICVATASELDIVKKILKRHNVAQYFDGIVSCTEAGAGKDKPDVFFAAEKFLGTPHKETWVIEDSALAIETAKKAGFPVVGVYDVNGVEQDRAKELSDIFLDDGVSFAELISQLEE
ncbi:MAG: HAD family phosphatase [Ruminococcaceae bacterium]|nr:HAD family phosphatase [Oscillospiraceae bacterium]